MENRKQLQYPFTAIVGQEEMKTALSFVAICPKIGGVLITGERGERVYPRRSRGGGRQYSLCG